MDIKMAWRNIWRNPRRTILTITAIAFASVLLIFMLSWQFGGYEIMINSSVKRYNGHLQVKADEYNEKKGMHMVVPDPGAVSGILDKIRSVTSYTYRANSFSLISSKERTYGVLVTGIAPEQEAKVSNIKKLVRQGDYLSESDNYQALVGRLLAKNLRVGLGDELTVLGQGRDGSVAATVVMIKGIFSSGIDEFDRSAIYIPLKIFQEVYSMRGAVHEVAVICDSLDDVPVVKTTIASGIKNIVLRRPLVVLDWDELMPGLLQSIKVDLVSGVIFYIFLVLVVAFSILNTFLMAIFERTKEFGILMAMGIKPNRLTRLLLIESMSMTAVGVVVGIIAGSIFTYYLQVHGFVISGTSEMLKQFGMPERIYPQLSWLSALSGPFLVMFITFLAALYPALKVRKLKPVEALVYT